MQKVRFRVSSQVWCSLWCIYFYIYLFCKVCNLLYMELCMSIKSFPSWAGQHRDKISFYWEGAAALDHWLSTVIIASISCPSPNSDWLPVLLPLTLWAGYIPIVRWDVIVEDSKIISLIVRMSCWRKL